MIKLPDLTGLSHDEKDALIHALWTQVQMLTAQVETLKARVAQLEAKLSEPPKTPDNSSVPPSQGKKPNHADKPKPEGPRKGSLGRKGGGRMLVEHPDETMIARPMCCARCRAAFDDGDQTLAARYDKFDLPKVKPVVTRVEQYAGHCRDCGSTTLAPLPDGLEPGSPFSRNIVALAIYLCFTHAISYRRLSRLMAELFSLAISEGALDAAFRRAMPCFDAEVSAILARLRRSRVGDRRKIGGAAAVGYFRVCSLTEGGCVAWMLRLVKIGVEGEGPCTDIMEFNRPDDLVDIANLGLTLAEAKRLLAGVQREIVAAQARDHAVRRPECPHCDGVCRVKDYRYHAVSTLFGQVRLRLPRFRCAACGGIEAGVGWPLRCRSTPELDRLGAHLCCQSALNSFQGTAFNIFQLVSMVSVAGCGV